MSTTGTCSVGLGRDASLPPKVLPRQQLWKRLLCLVHSSSACFRVCEQLPSEVFKCRVLVVFRVPRDLEKGGFVVDLSQQAYRYKICNELERLHVEMRRLAC